VKRQEGIATDIGWSGFTAGGMSPHQPVVIVVRRFYRSIDQVFGQVLVGDDKVEKPDGRVILGQRGIGAARQGGSAQL
jgi:hypothetical protein